MPSTPADSLVAVARRSAGAHPSMGTDELRPTGVDGLSVVEAQHATPLEATLYHPVVCLILQGAKEVELGTDRRTCSAGQSIIVSHELPLQSRITVASADDPYLALILELDVALLRRLVDDLDGVVDVGVEPAGPRPGALEVGDADAAVVDAFRRLLDLADTPVQAAALAPLVVHEIHFRLLLAEHGAALRRLLHRESHASRIAKAIGAIRGDLARPLVVADLAKVAGMSQSSFHQHFKAITATTPLQYQKDLRLLEARQLLGAGDRTVTDVAFFVGYQSPTQFSREYSRKFGTPPSSDRRRPAPVP